MNLYEINSKYHEVLAIAEAYAEDHEGEITPEMSDMLEAVSGERLEKIEACLKYYKNENAQADMIEEEAAIMKGRIEVHRSRAKWMKQYLSQIIGEGNKLELGCGSVSWRKSQTVEIIDAAAIPSRLMRIIPETREPDKILIKDAIKSGAFINGARMINKQNIQIK